MVNEELEMMDKEIEIKKLELKILELKKELAEKEGTTTIIYPYVPPITTDPNSQRPQVPWYKGPSVNDGRVDLGSEVTCTVRLNEPCDFVSKVVHCWDLAGRWSNGKRSSR